MPAAPPPLGGEPAGEEPGSALSLRYSKRQPLAAALRQAPLKWWTRWTNPSFKLFGAAFRWGRMDRFRCCSVPVPSFLESQCRLRRSRSTSGFGSFTAACVPPMFRKFGGQSGRAAGRPGQPPVVGRHRRPLCTYAAHSPMACRRAMLRMFLAHAVADGDGVPPTWCARETGMIATVRTRRSSRNRAAADHSRSIPRSPPPACQPPSSRWRPRRPGQGGRGVRPPCASGSTSWDGSPPVSATPPVHCGVWPPTRSATRRPWRGCCSRFRCPRLRLRW
jgi:hypothetical protein